MLMTCHVKFMKRGTTKQRRSLTQADMDGTTSRRVISTAHLESSPSGLRSNRPAFPAPWQFWYYRGWTLWRASLQGPSLPFVDQYTTSTCRQILYIGPEKI